MRNDSSISRVSTSDSTSALLRRKSNSDSIDVSKLSFFDELLSISQFAATIPKAPALPPAPPAASDSNPGNDSTGEQVTDSSGDKLAEGEKESDTSILTTAAQAFAHQQLMVQPTDPSAEPKAQKDNPDEHTHAIQGTKKQKQFQQAEQPDSSGTTTRNHSQDSVDAKAALGDNSNLQNTQVSNSQVEIESSAYQNSQPIALDSQDRDDGSPTPVDTTGDATKTKPIGKGRSSAKASDDDGADSKSSQDISLLTPVQNENNGETVQTNKDLKPTIEQVDHADKVDRAKRFDASADAGDQRRSKRSVRLAERASGDVSSSNERDPSSESSPLLEAQADATLADTTKDRSFASASTPSSSLPPAPAITPSFTPTIRISNSFSDTSITASATARSAIESVSAASTSTTKSVTGSSTTSTTISGTAPTASRSDSGRSEVARSNSGTPVTAYQAGKLVQRVLRGIEQLANGGGQVRLRLHPAELGSLQISLMVEAGHVSAKLEVENATARDALLNNVQSLKDRLSEQGIKVGSFEVEVSADSNGSGTSNSNFQNDGGSSGQSYRDNATSRFARQNSNRLPTDAVPTERTPAASWTRKNGSLDLKG